MFAQTVGMESVTADEPGRGIRARRRIIASGLLVVVIAGGLAVHALLPDTAGSDIAGDALYAAAAYLAVVLLAPGLTPLAVGAIAGAWCVAVELFQLTGLPLEWGATFRPAMLLLGTVFDPRDVAVYLVTVGMLTLADALATAAARRGRRP